MTKSFHFRLWVTPVFAVLCIGFAGCVEDAPNPEAEDRRYLLNEKVGPLDSILPYSYYTVQDLEHFFALAFPKDLPEVRLQKWLVNPQINAVGEVPPAWQDSVERTINSINKHVQGIRLEENPATANVHIRFVYREDYITYVRSLEPRWSRDKFGVCYWKDIPDRGRQKAVIVIDRNRDVVSVEKTIAHEMLHMMGFPGHTQVENSALHIGKRDSAGLSELDENALEILYNPKLKPGMNKREVKLALGLPF